MPYKLECIGFTNDSRSDSDRHTVIRNHDEALRRNVLSGGSPDIIKYGWPQKEWRFEGFDGDGEAKLTQGKNVQFITAEEYQKALAETVKTNQKKSFDAIREFFIQHGVLYSLHEDKKYYSWRSQALLGGVGGDMGTIWSSDRSFTHRVNDIYVGENVETMELEFKQYGNVAFMGFNNDGDFTSRDYNFDIEQRYNRQDMPDYQKIYDRFIDAIRKLGSALKSPASDDKWFYESRAAVIEFEQKPDWNQYSIKISVVPPQTSGTYKLWRMSGFKRPKKMVEISADEIVALVEEKYLSNLKPLFLAPDKLNFDDRIKEE